MTPANPLWRELTPPYATIVADPPWPYEDINPPNPLTGYKGAKLPYSGMSLDDIRKLPVADLAQDTRLYLWTTNRFLRHAWSVIEAWGFTPQDRVLVWVKPPMSTLNVTTEFVLVAKRGSPPRMPWHNTTWFAWPRPTVHSQKPAPFGDLVESWSPGPYLELFARAPRLGWDAWGHGYELSEQQTLL